MSRLADSVAAATNVSQRTLVLAINAVTDQLFEELVDAANRVISGFAMGPPGSFSEVALVP